ncbi:2-acylglycerol O-acyltransferase 1-like [Macrobrachium rosenbergii]|uniref:2-acylglycerol O-acyltransferase 1-like n=1 Tax=Macrobrachium rosenbergii TaxID=79674 RepID=UPI0034D66DAE
MDDGTEGTRVEEVIQDEFVKVDLVTKKGETDNPEIEKEDTNSASTEDKQEEKKVPEIDEEELKKLNRKVPDARSEFKKDHVDEHFDSLPWILGALGRVLSLPLSYGPKFAPINIPLSRRLQTFAVFFWMSSFLFMGFGSLIYLVYLFFYTEYWWFSLAYFTWYLGDRTICVRGGRRIEWIRNWSLWRSYRDFFPAHLIKTAELDPSKNYIMGYHPHGVLSAGAYCHFATEGTHFSKVFKGLTPYLLTLECHFKLPFYRELFMGTGAVSATRASMDYLLSQEGTGRALCLVVGGAKESLDAHPGQDVILHLSKRKGFCKMALRHGASLVPMFSFGENEVYDQVPNPQGSLLRKAQNTLQQALGLAPVIFMGRGIFQYSFGIVPFRKPIYTVVGSPIDVPQVKNPTSQEIVELHAKYTRAVIDLYNKYKDRYSEHPELQIKIV